MHVNVGKYKNMNKQNIRMIHILNKIMYNVLVFFKPYPERN